MNDKNFARFFFIVTALFILWWYLSKRQSTAQIQSPNGTPLVFGNPEVSTYSANPSAFGPQTLNGTVNINVSGYNGLNQNYIPLFGFVGMAQGETYR